MRRQRKYIAGGTVLALVASGAFLINTVAEAGGTQVLSSRLTASAIATPMQTITPYQLQWMHLYLSPAPASVALTSDQAIQAVTKAGIAYNGGPVLETVLARCSMTPGATSEAVAWADRPCWVVSIQPGTIQVDQLGGASGPPAQVTPTVEVELVDANTGVIFSEASGTPSAQAPTQP